MLLCKTCGYPISYSGEPSSGTVRCTAPGCKVSCMFYGKDVDARTSQFVRENCVKFDVEDALDRTGRIEELLWWIAARKSILESGMCDGVGGPQLKGISLAIEEVVAVKAHVIVKTLTREK